MITLVEHGTIAKYLGLSTDEKPSMISDAVGMPNGSRFLEMDTGDKYYWDADHASWCKAPEEEGEDTPAPEPEVLDIFDLSIPVGDITTNATQLVNVGARTNVTSVTAPNATTIGDGAFKEWKALTKVSAPNVVSITGKNQFCYCSRLTAFVMPKLSASAAIETSTFSNCVSLKYFDAPVGTIWSNAFMNCSELNTVILRGESVTVPKTNAFNTTPIAQNGYSTIYVPSALVETYKAEAHWADLIAANIKLKILPIEGSIYETQYADGTPVGA